MNENKGETNKQTNSQKKTGEIYNRKGRTRPIQQDTDCEQKRTVWGVRGLVQTSGEKDEKNIE